MSVEIAVRDHLLSRNPVAVLVGLRAYQLKLPQKPVLPAVRLHLLDDPRRHHLRGPDGANKSWLQIDSYASELVAGDPYLVASNVADAIEGALDGQSFLSGGIRITGAFQRSKKPAYEPPELRLVRFMQEFEVWWKVAAASDTVDLTTLRMILAELSGSQDDVQVGNTYPSGAALAGGTLVPGSSVWEIDSHALAGAQYGLQGIVKVFNGTAKATLALFNLDDAPDTALTGSAVQSSAGVETGELITSGAITFPAGGTAKRLGVKMKTDEVAGAVAAWGLRIVRLP